MEIVRQSYWEDGLRTYLDRVSDERFAYGELDCVLFSAGAINAMCGVDPAEGMRGIYSDARGAAQVLRDRAQGTLLKTVTHWLGKPKPVSLSHRGDIVMLNRFTTGVCVGHFSAFVGAEQGFERMIFLPTRDCSYAFTVPYAQ